MQAPSPLHLNLDLFADRPTVGGLMTLCEDNYALLHRLAPTLPTLNGRQRSRVPGQADLRLEVLEQSRYTTLLHLTHAFTGLIDPQDLDAEGLTPEPDALLRAYHDAGQVEVLNLRQTVLPLFSHYGAPALAAKWRANLFLSKWLGYCVREGHRFPPLALRPTPISRRPLATDTQV